MKKRSKASLWKDFVIFMAGGSLYAISVNVFTAPAAIAPGGATGIATLLNHLFSLPIGGMILVLNLPLFLLSVKILGIRFLPKTIAATVISSLLIDIFSFIIPPYTGNRLLAALYGGVFAGIGLSLIFLRGGTTGGTDLAAKLLKRVLPTFSLGQLILILDSIIIVLSAVVYRDVDSGLYACLVIFASTTIIDRLLYNAGMGKVLYIISGKSDRVCAAIMQQLQRGATMLKGTGGFSGEEKCVLLCVVRRGEVWRARQIVEEIDPNAFMVVSDAGQVMGEGFSLLSDSNS